jgi:hypothetical protein
MERDAKPAPHGIVQALFNKRKVPKLSADISIKEENNSTDNIVVRIKNESTIPAEKVSFIIDIYNIKNVESIYNFNYQDDQLGEKFSMSNNSDQVLVQIINLPIHFKIEHIKKDYLIFVAFWCRDVDFDFKYFTYSPNDKKIITEATYNEGMLLLDELERIYKKSSK